MRLDHLLSREPVNWGCMLVGVFRFVCVSCAYILTLPVVGGGCGCVIGLGIGTKQACCRVHVQHLLGVKPTTVGTRFLVLVVVWCVVCDLYSG